MPNSLLAPIVKSVVALLTLVGGPLVARDFFGIRDGLQSDLSVTAASADYRSCFTVMHEYAPTTMENPVSDVDYVASEGANGGSYRVDFRLRRISDGSWTPWAPGANEKAGAGGPGGVYAYMYDTGTQDGGTYDEVEWRVLTDRNPGTNLRSEESIISIDDFGSNGFTVLKTSGPCHDDATVNEIQWDFAMVGYQHDEG